MSLVNSSSSEDSSSDSSDDDEDSGDGSELLFRSRPNSLPTTLSALPNNSDSDSSSSDSSSEDESESDEDLKQSVDENTSMMLEQVSSDCTVKASDTELTVRRYKGSCYHLL